MKSACSGGEEIATFKGTSQLVGAILNEDGAGMIAGKSVGLTDSTIPNQTEFTTDAGESQSLIADSRTVFQVQKEPTS